MKTIKLLFTATAAAIVAIAAAVEKPKMSVVPLSADRAVVSILNERAAYFELSVKASNGDIVYYKQTSKALTDYQKIFDFENLENGNYTLNLKVNDTSLSRSFEVTNKAISVGESKLRFDPYFTFEDNKLKFSYLNFDEENFKLNIYNSSDLVYQSKLGKDFAISSGFDLEQLEAGNYKVVLTSFSNEFVYKLEK